MNEKPMDDINPGDWVVVVRVKEHEVSSMFGPIRAVVHRPYSGDPLMVLALNLPFVVVVDPTSKERANLDLRYYDIAPVKKSYLCAALSDEDIARVSALVTHG